MTLRFVSPAWLRLLLAAALAAPVPLAAQNAAKPAPKSRSVQITTRSPDASKWNLTVSNPTHRVFVCKPLVCLDPETVSFNFQKGSLVEPNEKSLEKFANVDLPKSMRAIAAAQSVITGGAETIETLNSTATRLKNYPAVLNETKFSRGPDSVYVEVAIIFAGPVIVKMESRSRNQDLAQKSLNQFIDAMQIVDVPTPRPGKPQISRPPKSENI